MASVFLSYVREDLEKARAIAAALERHDHFVWWDRHIRGGAEFGAEIERALNAADKVVVLWSTRSIQSAWVRDEAAFGRDSGRLVPLSLDGTEPPLGFRQFHTVDFSSWDGDGEGSEFQLLLDSLDGNRALKPPAEAGRPRRKARLAPLMIGLAALFALAFCGVLLFHERAPRVPIVAVTPASGDARTLEAARDLGVALASLQAANTNAFHLIATSADSNSRADVLLQVASAQGTGKADRTILSGSDHSILWAGSFGPAAGGAETDVPRQLSVTAARLMSCALDAFLEDKPRLDEDIVRLYLSGCADLEDEIDETSSDLSPIFEKVTERAPHFAAAWDKLLYSEAYATTWQHDPRLVTRLRAHLAQSRRLGVDTPSAALATAALKRGTDYLGRLSILEEGVRQHPNESKLELALADALTSVGRETDAVHHAMRAAELNPISPAIQGQYIWILQNSGRSELAKRQLEVAQRQWPTSKFIRTVRRSYEVRYGDPRVGLALLAEGGVRHAEESAAAFAEARLDPSPQKIEQAIVAAKKDFRSNDVQVQPLTMALGEFGRSKEAIDTILAYDIAKAPWLSTEPFFRPMMRVAWRDPRFMTAMAHLGLVSYWSRSGRWPDFCFEPTLPYDCKAEAAKLK